MLEEQGFPSPWLLHHAIGDLTQLEIHRYRLRDANQLARLVERVDECAQVIEGHVPVVSGPAAGVNRGDAKREHAPAYVAEARVAHASRELLDVGKVRDR